ncbi:MAG: hypothetical protein CVU09_00350 [Bacteroidetes bacterium HGW-Bacteroidetes-4]|jgi:hypothetical protein|nr:MAG: hypothetical protein CVU09_00350 [Bacteroidetes bacterium HGW-Bacteroidetes-4]
MKPRILKYLKAVAPQPWFHQSPKPFPISELIELCQLQSIWESKNTLKGCARCDKERPYT